jgi:8-oxo-dGTP pyrophosphatase MutT (NUDIX family)
MPNDWVEQTAAIPIRDGRVCLITSRSKERWVVPKGMIDAGRTAEEMALVEAWEEAGLRGELVGESIGSFTYPKNGRTYHVTAFVMRVTEVLDEWPEDAFREREWLTPREAARRVTGEDLRELILSALG